jgi:streptogramin lyase
MNASKAAFVLAVSALLAAPRAQAVKITEYIAEGNPQRITTGPDGRLWFCEGTGFKVGAITTSGALTEYPTETGAECEGITAAFGDIWITEATYKGQLGQLNVAGYYGASPGGTDPTGITSGDDGRVWWVDGLANIVRALRIWGNAPPTTTYTLSAGASPADIALGPDGRMWVTEYAGDAIAACDPSGTTCIEYSLAHGANPLGIAAGPDGNLWIAESGLNRIQRMTVGGAINGTFPVPTASSSPSFITAGRDGYLWFTEASGNKIALITTSGEIVEYPIPTPASLPWGITAGPDGAIWFAEASGQKIGRLELHVPGDMNGDGSVNIADVFTLINFLFAGGPLPD